MATSGREKQSSSANAQKSTSRTGKVNIRSKTKINDEVFEGMLEKCKDHLTDILSSDSDDSSLEEIKQEILSSRKNDQESLDTTEEQVEEITEEEGTLERMAFYSVYINDGYCIDKRPPPEPQYSEGYDKFETYSGAVAYIKDAELKKHFVVQESDEKFEKMLKSGIGADFSIGDIDGNISLKTLAENNYRTLDMDGPTRKIALLFDFKPVQDLNISNKFRDFMSNQKKLYHFIGGALLLYDDIGIHVVEGSEYVLLRHFPHFFDSELYKILRTCKVLGVEELSAMKSFKQYACYNGTPQALNEPMKEKISTYQESVKFLKNLGKHLNAFLNFAYGDDPSIFDDNVIPERIEAKLPPKEYLQFALNGNWPPGLRPALNWYYNNSVITLETDDSEFVWPPRQDHLPAYVLNSNPEEDENLIKATNRKMKSVKLPCSQKTEIEEGRQSQKKHRHGQASDDEDLDSFAELLDEEYQFSSEESEKFPEGEKGYDSQSSILDPEELNPEMEDYLEIIENITGDK